MEEFAACVQNSSNAFVIITREALENLPYSVREIYGMRSSGKYNSLQPVYHELYPLYDHAATQISAQQGEVCVITEDSRSGFQFFSAAGDGRVVCLPAGGNARIFALAEAQQSQQTVLVIADGAAFGPYINRLAQLAHRRKNMRLYLPESFEWLILKSGLIDGKRVRQLMEMPEAVRKIFTAESDAQQQT